MARYTLYCVGASGNSYKVALYLSCAGVRPGTTPPKLHHAVGHDPRPAEEAR